MCARLIVDWDGLFWGDRSIDSMAAHKLNSVVYPKAVALATWTFLNVLSTGALCKPELPSDPIVSNLQGNAIRRRRVEDTGSGGGSLFLCYLSISILFA